MGSCDSVLVGVDELPLVQHLPEKQLLAAMSVVAHMLSPIGTLAYSHRHGRADINNDCKHGERWKCCCSVGKQCWAKRTEWEPHDRVPIEAQ
eukprot:5705398-Amphidinium_carterae.1